MRNSEITTISASEWHVNVHSGHTTQYRDHLDLTVSTEESARSPTKLSYKFSKSEIRTSVAGGQLETVRCHWVLHATQLTRQGHKKTSQPSRSFPSTNCSITGSTCGTIPSSAYSSHDGAASGDGNLALTPSEQHLRTYHTLRSHLCAARALGTQVYPRPAKSASRKHLATVKMRRCVAKATAGADGAWGSRLMVVCGY